MNEPIYTFPNGLPGFEDCTEFRLYVDERGDTTLYQLQSVAQPEVEFNLIEPTAFGLHYEFTLDDAEQELIEAKSAEELVVFLVLARGEGSGQSAIHANVSGPLILNVNSRKGLQKVLAKVDYSLNLRGK